MPKTKDQLTKHSSTKKSTTTSRTKKPTDHHVVRRSGVYHSKEDQCSEITTQLGRCKNTATNGTPFCKTHQRRRYTHEERFFDSTFAYVGYGVWIGSLDTIHDPKALQTAGIKGIVNISGWEPREKVKKMYEKLGIKYYTTTTRGSDGRLCYLGDEPIGKGLSLENFYKYMDRGVQMVSSSPKPVLINCYAGVNRSASLVSAYLIAKKGLTFSESHKLLIEANRKRSIDVLTNKYFVQAMSHYSEYLRRKGRHR